MTHPSTLATPAQLDAAAATVLAGIAGPGATVRPDQLAAATALACEGRRALVVQATGWGKSAVYWMATKALRDAGAGPTLVVSPLLALMRDQVAAAEKSGLRAATLNSSNFDDWPEIQADLRAGRLDVLLTSPERLANPVFARDVLPGLLAQLGMLVIDEAHCVSSWGHDFRPDYRRLATVLVQRPDLPVLATTATANTRVSDDVAEQLGDGTVVLRGPLARASLHLSVLPRLGEVEAFAWVDEHLDVLPGSGIVYAPTVKMVTQLAAYLGERGHAVRAYHGQMPTDERQRVEGMLRVNEVKAVIATSALGMGYDKPDLGFVVHVGSPGSPVDYYQQVGRAGRALDTAQVVLIPTPADEDIWRYFATASIPKEEDATAVIAELGRSTGSMSVPALEAATGIRRGRLELLVKVLAVEGGVERTTEGWAATGERWEYDRERYDALLLAREHEAALMRAYARSARCLEGVLREALDDPVATDCGRCSVCTGRLPEGLAAGPSPDSVRAALAFMRGADVVLEPRKMWAAGLAWSGRIGSGLAIQPGRALAFANDPAWPSAVRLAGGSDAEVPPDVVDGLTQVLARWRTQWVERPTVIVAVPSTRHPEMVRSLADAISRVGRIPVRHGLRLDGPPGDADAVCPGSRPGAGPPAEPAARGLVRGGDGPARRRCVAHRLDGDDRRRPPARGGRRPRPAAGGPPAALGVRGRSASGYADSVNQTCG